MSENKSSLKVLVQKVGTALSSMVMPNIGAFIAWGLITALFIPTGWMPNAKLAALVAPMIFFLLPLLISYSAGKNVHDERGGVVAAIATMGVIVGTVTINEKGLGGTPMFLGAMVMGPIAAHLMKKFDKAVQPKIKTGLEMLVNNFSAGILGFILAILGFFGIGPIVKVITNALSAGVDLIINAHLLPLANVFIEPAKILFLNNAINHGILTPIATEQALNTGKSVLYLLEANPGVGLGILLAYVFFGKGFGDKISELLNIPENALFLCGLSIGVKDEELSTEKVKPRLPDAANVGYNEFPKSNVEVLKEYRQTMVDFAEARETKTWTKKFADFYAQPSGIEKVTKELLEKNGFVSEKEK